MAIGDKIKATRKKSGLSQAEFANLCGISQSALAFWETGKRKPKYEQLVKISKLFDVSIDYLIKDEDADKKFENTDLYHQITYLEMVDEFLDIPNIRKYGLITEEMLCIYKDNIKELLYKCRNSEKTTTEEKSIIVDGLTEELTRDLLIRLAEQEKTVTDMSNIFYLLMYYFSLNYEARDILIERAKELTLIKIYQYQKD